jgi:hypothetical protein
MTVAGSVVTQPELSLTGACGWCQPTGQLTSRAGLAQDGPWGWPYIGPRASGKAEVTAGETERTDVPRSQLNRLHTRTEASKPTP